MSDKCLLLCRVRGTNYYMVFTGYGKPGELNYDYLVEEHSCPANFVRHPCLFAGEDDINFDPHGMFEYVASAPIPEDFDLTFGFHDRIHDGSLVPADAAYTHEEVENRWFETFPELKELKKSPKTKAADVFDASMEMFEFNLKEQMVTIRETAKDYLARICEVSGMELYSTPEGPRIRKKDTP